MGQSELLAMLRSKQPDEWQAVWGGDYGGCSEKRAARNGIPPKYWNAVVGQLLKHDVKAKTPVTQEIID